MPTFRGTFAYELYRSQSELLILFVHTKPLKFGMLINLLCLLKPEVLQRYATTGLSHNDGRVTHPTAINNFYAI